MSYVIAIAGKGGTGKTTVASMLVRLLVESGRGSVLAVDADPNSNLGEALGVKSGETIGEILDRVAQHPDKIPGGMTKDRFIEFEVQSAVKEADGFDLLAMGKPEGPGCYCYVNNVLRGCLEKLTRDYDFVVIDNEAGMEHLSRRTSRSADCLLLVAQARPVALKAAQRIAQLAAALKLKTGKTVLLLNMVGAADDAHAADGLAETGMIRAGSLPQDAALAQLNAAGGSVWELDPASAAFRELSRAARTILGVS